MMNPYIVKSNNKSIDCPYGNHFSSFDRFNEKEVIKFYNDQPVQYRVYCCEAKKSFGLIFCVEWRNIEYAL